MIQYVNGSKKPSKERENAIMQEIKNVAGELQVACI